MDFSHINSIQDLLYYIQSNEGSIPPSLDSIIPLLTSIDGANYLNIVKTLKSLGMNDIDERRIFRYPSGRYIHDNRAPYIRHLIVYSLRSCVDIDVSELKRPIKTIYLDNDVGIVIPVFIERNIIYYEAESKYYLWGTKILIIPDIPTAIASLSEGKIESNRIERLLKLIERGTSYMYDYSSGIIYNFKGQLRTLRYPNVDIYLNAMDRLDALPQIYPENFLIEENGSMNETLYNMLMGRKDTEFISYLNKQSYFTYSSPIFTKMNIAPKCDVLTLYLLYNLNGTMEDYKGKDIQGVNNNLTITKFRQCTDEYIFLRIVIVKKSGNIQIPNNVVMQNSTMRGTTKVVAGKEGGQVTSIGNRTQNMTDISTTGNNININQLISNAFPNNPTSNKSTIQSMSSSLNDDSVTIINEMFLIYNKGPNIGFIFDPMTDRYVKSAAKSSLYNEVGNHVRKVFSPSTIRPILINPSDLIYPITKSTPDIDDIQYRAWSFYIGILYMYLRNIQIKKIIESVTNLTERAQDRYESMKVVIPRFLIWVYGVNAAKSWLKSFGR